MKKSCKKKPIKPILDSNKFNLGGLSGFDPSALAAGTGFGQSVDMSGLNLKANSQMAQLAGTKPTAPQGIPGAGAMPYLGAAQGAIELGSQIAGNFNKDGIGKEVVGTQDMSRQDVLNTNVNVDANKSNVAGESVKGLATGLKAGMAFGPMGAAIGAGVGLIGGLGSSLIGNAQKQRLADQKEAE